MSNTKSLQEQIEMLIKDYNLSELDPTAPQWLRDQLLKLFQQWGLSCVGEDDIVGDKEYQGLDEKDQQSIRYGNILKREIRDRILAATQLDPERSKE